LVRRLSTKSPELKVLYMSGYSEEGDLSAMSDVERAVVLKKPFAPKLLESEIRKILDRDQV
jgi:DNA-binding response OmpR family regulator